MAGGLGLVPLDTAEPEKVSAKLATGVLAQAGLGALEALAPFALGKRELVEEAPQGLGEIAARVGSRIGVDLATTALAGIAGGALAGPPGALAAMAATTLYRSLGTEAMHGEATGEEF